MQAARIATISLVCLLTLIPQAQAVDTAGLAQSLRQSGIWKPDTPINVDVTDEGEVTVTTVRNPKAVANDCKIDAVLVGKQLMDADQKDIKRVKVHFFYTADIYDNRFDEIVVREGDVKAYAAKAIAQKDLLESLGIATSGFEDKVTELTVSGAVPQKIDALGQMVNLTGHMRRLEGRGIDISPFQPVLTNIVGLLDKQQFAVAEHDMAQLSHRLQAVDSTPVATGLQTAGGAAPQAPAPAANSKPPAVPKQPAGGQTQPAGHAVSFSAYNAQGPLALVRPAVPINWRPVFQHANKQLREILGFQAPIGGFFAGQRCRVIAKIRQLQDEGNNVDDVLKAYLNIEEYAKTKMSLTRSAINDLVKQLTLPPAPKSETKAR